MPFTPVLDNIYGNIKKALNDNDYVCNRSDEILESKPIMNKVLNEIMKAHYIIADLTGQNANVFYELGIAHTFKDSPNIILIAQSKDDIPFDINHMNRIVYDPGNIKYLTSTIIENIRQSRYLYGFYEVLQQRNIISVIHSDEEDFVGFVQHNLEDTVQIATKILYRETADCTSADIEEYFNKLITVMHKAFTGNQPFHIPGVMRIMQESLISCAHHPVSDKVTYDLLDGSLLSAYPLPPGEVLSLKTDLAIALVSQGIKINTVMTWIIDYFTKSKSATVDLNRYKVERFLMITNDERINGMIIDSVFHKDCHIREHLADIIGEKRLYGAEASLLKQLSIEDNHFTMVSLVAALGKLEAVPAGGEIMRMIAAHIGDIVRTKQFFVLKHCRIALERLDRKHNTYYSEEFDRKYGEYVRNYFIL